MNKGHIPIRMCIICKGRFKQETLHKFPSKNFNSSRNCRSGRNFYICNTCINQDSKILKKKLSKYAQSQILDIENLKERLLNGECSDSRNSS